MTMSSVPTTGDRPSSTDERDVVPAVWSRYTDIVVDHGEGAWIVDVEGRRFLDYSSGIGVTSTGHAHPRVAQAIADQAHSLIHGQQNIVYHRPGLQLHQRLATTLPDGPWKVFLANSGAEAIENAVKLARAATGRHGVVTFHGAFHGRTAQTMAMTTSRHVVRAGFEPLPAGVHHVPYPYCYRAQDGPHTPERCSCPWEAHLEQLFEQVIPPSQVAALVVEPVLGEGGYVVPPPTFLPRLRDIASRHGILLVVDEIQTGVGRTGRFWCVDHSAVGPDVVVFAKGIASGMPLSGIIGRAPLIERLAAGSLGGTYGGNVVACAAALATLDVIEAEGLVDNARDRGAQLLDGLRQRLAHIPVVGDIRGLGLMVGLEFVHPSTGSPGRPNPEAAKMVLTGSLDEGLIVLSAGSSGHVVRLVPPLVTTAEEVDHAAAIIARVVEAAAGGLAGREARVESPAR